MLQILWIFFSNVKWKNSGFTFLMFTLVKILKIKGFFWSICFTFLMLTFGKILKIKGFFWSICFVFRTEYWSPHIPCLLGKTPGKNSSRKLYKPDTFCLRFHCGKKIELPSFSTLYFLIFLLNTWIIPDAIPLGLISHVSISYFKTCF